MVAATRPYFSRVSLFFEENNVIRLPISQRVNRVPVCRGLVMEEGGGQSGANKTVKLTNSVGDKGCDKGGGMALFVPAACMHACMYACMHAGAESSQWPPLRISSIRWSYARRLN